MADTPFRVTHAKWLETEAARIAAILLTPTRIKEKWDHKKLKQELQRIGLDYSLAEITELNDELHRQGIIEDV